MRVFRRKHLVEQELHADKDAGGHDVGPPGDEFGFLLEI
jgi:hypothetical protein